jgi:hypothetical protein
MITIRSCLMLAAVMLCGSALHGADPYGLEKGTPELKSADVLAFGVDGILFVGDAQTAAVFAIQTGDKSGNPPEAMYDIEGLNVKIAEQLGGSSQSLKINDLAVNPASGNLYLAIANAEQPAIVRIDHQGAISEVELKDIPFARADLPNPPKDEAVGEGNRRRNPRGESITDLAFVDGQVIVTGLSSADAPSTVRSFAFPFSKVDKGVSLEIYHGAHGRVEDNAVVRTFVPFMIGGEPNLLAGFTCTPLVKFPLSEVQSGEGKVEGTTVAELGNRNRPLDMIVYEKDGKNYLLIINSSRGTMKVSTEKIEANAGITEPVTDGDTAGQEYETIDELAGAVQLDKLNDTTAVILAQTDSGALDLRSVELP